MVLVLYPALITTLGDIGSILGSMETTKLALGYVSSFTHVLRDIFVVLISIEAAAFIVHTIFAFVTPGIECISQILSDLLQLIQTAELSNLFSFFFI